MRTNTQLNDKYYFKWDIYNTMNLKQYVLLMLQLQYQQIILKISNI